MNGKAIWITVIGLMLTMSGIIYQGGSTIGQIREKVENSEKTIEQLKERQNTIADVLVQQARGEAKRKHLQRQIERLEDEVNRLQDRGGPHQTTGDDDGT